MSTTKYFVVVAMIVIGIYDAIAGHLWGVDGTISRFMQDTAFNSPAFPFIFGFLAGHFWGYMPPKLHWATMSDADKKKLIDEISDASLKQPLSSQTPRQTPRQIRIIASPEEGLSNEVPKTV